MARNLTDFHVDLVPTLTNKVKYNFPHTDKNSKSQKLMAEDSIHVVNM